MQMGTPVKGAISRYEKVNEIKGLVQPRPGCTRTRRGLTSVAVVGYYRPAAQTHSWLAWTESLRRPVGEHQPRVPIGQGIAVSPVIQVGFQWADCISSSAWHHAQASR